MRLAVYRRGFLVPCLAAALAVCGSEGDQKSSEDRRDDFSRAVEEDGQRVEAALPEGASGAGDRIDQREEVGDLSVDLESFHGEYGNPDDPDDLRTWWVTTEPCEERGLRVGAMWGDADPWDLLPESDRIFTGTAFGGMKVRASFGPEDEVPRSLQLEFGENVRELVRFRDLPDGFQTRCWRG